MFDERERGGGREGGREWIILIAMMPGRQTGHFSHLLLEEEVEEEEKVNEVVEEKEETMVEEVAKV